MTPKPLARPVSRASAAVAGTQGISLFRCHALAYRLASSLATLMATPSRDVPVEHLEAYLRMGWLRWEAAAAGGRERLQLTREGSRVCAALA